MTEYPMYIRNLTELPKEVFQSVWRQGNPRTSAPVAVEYLVREEGAEPIPVVSGSPEKVYVGALVNVTPSPRGAGYMARIGVVTTVLEGKTAKTVRGIVTLLEDVPLPVEGGKSALWIDGGLEGESGWTSGGSGVGGFSQEDLDAAVLAGRSELALEVAPEIEALAQARDEARREVEQLRNQVAALRQFA